LSWAERHKIRLLLAAATLIPLAAFVWLGFRIFQQERDLDRQRERERLEVAAGRLAIATDRRLSEIQEQLVRGEGLHFKPEGIEAIATAALPFQPLSSNTEAAFAATFSAAETEEFQHNNPKTAAKIYESFARSPDPGVRAGALMRLARVHRKVGDAAGALQDYNRLLALHLTTVAGQPAELVARQGRARIFEEAHNIPQLQHEAGEFARILYSGALPVDRATFEFYSDLLTKWGVGPPPEAAIARTEAAIELWIMWRASELPVRGRRLFREKSIPVLAVWEGQTVWLATPSELHDIIGSLADARKLEVSISDVDGQPVFGAMQSTGISLTPRETRLPFILSVSSKEHQKSQARMLFVSGSVIVLLLMIVAAAALYRVTTREILLARQQSDFVSAVSHEFRTPLTSMRHLTDLLVSRSVASEERKSQYYELLAHETERLHRMVESLLSFGRIEAGGYAWQLAPTDIGELARVAVEEFRCEPDANGREILCEVAESLPPARIDREAFSRALWNLIENAAKYSDRGKPIRVFVRRDNNSLLAGVEDHGYGIAVSEQARIFQKFVRGSDAKRAGVRGVGIGLALVKRIVEAHGGSVRVESEPGRGSTFTLVIPCPES
jgi:signal transduction histidine kinase